ncbi:MAG: DMT family transporter [Candidatus Latescibacterota bacterium]|nr:DMT family transporter [Candidatus Latescibacterota bacterium]
MRNDSVGLNAACWALLMAVLWGGNSVAIKIGLTAMPPVSMAALRFFFGIFTIWLGCIFVGVSIRVPFSAWRGLFGLGLLFTTQIWLLNAGTNYTTASRSGVLINIFPFFVAIFSHLLVPGDRISAVKAIGLVCSFLGISLLFIESIRLEDTQYLLGDAMVTLSGLLLGLRQVVLKLLVQGLHPLQVLFWQAGIGLPLFVLWSILFENEVIEQMNWTVWLAVLYQGVVVAGFCFVLMVLLLRHHSATRLGVFSFVTPIVGILLSAWILDEVISFWLWISVLLVTIGIVVANRAENVLEKNRSTGE